MRRRKAAPDARETLFSLHFIQKVDRGKRRYWYHKIH